MGNIWQECQQRFNTLSLREQWLIAIAGWLSIIFVGFLLVVEPQLLRIQQDTNKLVSLENNVISARNQQLQLQRQLSEDPNASIQAKIEQLQLKNQQLDQQLQQKIGGLISPIQMSGLLEQVLSYSRNLQLQSLVSLPSEQLITGEDQGYYIHPIRLNFRGKYFDVIDYLTTLEALPVNYYWRNLSYQVVEYPWANIALDVYTLGESKDFIGG